jgi:hypothetical protein
MNSTNRRESLDNETRIFDEEREFGLAARVPGPSGDPVAARRRQGLDVVGDDLGP